MKRLRLFGGFAVAAALVFPAAPAFAEPVVPVTKNVEISVVINDGSFDYPLPGAQVTVSTGDESSELASGVTGDFGPLSLSVTGEPVVHRVDAVWPGAKGLLDTGRGEAEFNLENDAPVTVRISGAAATLFGAVSATVEGESMASFDGASVIVTSGGVEVRRVAVAANGGYAVGVLPASDNADYALNLVPPVGYVLAATQPSNEAFSLAAGPGAVANYLIDRTFALVAETPKPEPEPEDEVRPEPTPETGTPSLDDRMDVIFRFTQGAPSGGVSLGGQFLNIPEAGLDGLFDMTSGGASVPIMSNDGQMLGFAQQTTPQTQQYLNPTQGAVVAGSGGLSAESPSLAVVDIKTALAAVQAERDRQALLEEQKRIEDYAKLNAAVLALGHYLQDPHADRLSAAIEAARAAKLDFTEPPTDATALRSWAEDLAQRASTKESMERLRMQTAQAGQKAALEDAMRKFMTAMEANRGTQVIGSMRSEPVAIGSVQLNAGVKTGAFDLSGVAPGEHHLILHYEGTGITTVSKATVRAGGDQLADTGAVNTPAAWLAGLSFMMLGVVALGAARLRRRSIR